MSLWIEEKYVAMVGAKLKRFHRQSKTTYAFRCPFCGDSKKRANVTRGYFFTHKGRYVFKCHNCNESASLRGFLKRIDEGMYREYQMDLLRQEREVPVSPPQQQTEEDMFGKFRTKPRRIPLPSLASLPDEHIAVKYIRGRKLPDEALKHLHFTEQWGETIKTLKWDYHIPSKDDGVPRLVLPWYNADGVLQGAQTRRIDVPGKDSRYVTYKSHDDVEKVYGLERLNRNHLIYIVEGPLDSFFLPNCCAAMGSDLRRTHEQFLPHHKVVYVWDNEPRNRELIQTMEPAVKAGASVVIWPSALQEKDLNDMAKADHDVLALVQTHTYSGLRAQLEFLRWRKSFDDAKGIR